MIAGQDGSTSAEVVPDGATFELERFAWAAPDRLELAGRFAGLRDVPSEPPVLVVRGAHETQRLPAVPGSISGSPSNEGRWRAEFAWSEAPTAFEVAELQLGGGIVVELPEPGARRRSFRRHVIKVRRQSAAGVAEPIAPEQAAPLGPTGEAGPSGPAGEAEPGAGADRLRLQADLLAAQEDIRELRAELQRAQEDLANTREALEAERARNGANAEEFRQALATVRKSAEEALAVERTAVQQLGNDVREAHELVAARDAAVADLRAKLEAAASDQAEVSRLRERVTVLEAAAHEADALRERLSALEADATETQRLRDHLAGTHKAVAEAYTDVEAVLARLASVRDAVSEGGGDPSSA